VAAATGVAAAEAATVTGEVGGGSSVLAYMGQGSEKAGLGDVGDVQQNQSPGNFGYGIGTAHPCRMGRYQWYKFRLST